MIKKGDKNILVDRVDGMVRMSISESYFKRNVNRFIIVEEKAKKEVMSKSSGATKVATKVASK